MSRLPLLGSPASRNKPRPRGIFSLFFSGGIFNFGSDTTYSGICLMLNADDIQDRDGLTEKWRDHKLEELNFVGTVGALLAGCLSSAGAWPDVLDNGNSKPWTVRACWHGGLVFALFAVLVAGQQSMRLHRLSAHRDGLALIRSSLSLNPDQDDTEMADGNMMDDETDKGMQHPHAIQLYAWEASILFLMASVACMIAGLTILVWVSTEYGPEKPREGGWWDENSKMAVSFTAVLAVSTIIFMASQCALAETKKPQGSQR